MDEYDFTPRIRSYLQTPVSETQKFVEDVSVPRLTEMETAREAELPERRLLEIPDVSKILIDKKIDPDEYIVGPGDMMTVYLWGELDQDFPLSVHPEGYVIVPTVGTVQVSDIPLSLAKERIEEKVREKYEDIEITIALVEPRRFRVFVSGVIVNPGMYSAHALLRVSDLLVETQRSRGLALGVAETALEFERGGLISRSQLETRGAKRGSSKRSIKIYRGDSEIPVDLLAFEKTGDLKSNPYVAGGDHIYVPPYQGDIMIIGEVNNEGIFEFKEGDRIADLVVFGGGLTVIADSSNANLVRFTEGGDELINIPIDIYDAVFHNPDDPRYRLKESDRLFVQTKYKYKVLAHVTVDGQVKYPGSYAIIPHESTLTQIIGMAGGFTEYANLEEARIIRMSSSALRDLEYERLRLMLVADMTDEEYEFFKHRSRQQEGMISIDFVKLFREHDMTYEMLLEEGDHIFIPLKRELVNVLGAVQEPGYMKVAPGQSIDYYVQLAGGYNWNAKTGGVRIIKGKTGQRLRPGEDVIIEGGDTIHIPEKAPINYWESFLEGAQLFANLATLIIIARNLSK